MTSTTLSPELLARPAAHAVREIAIARANGVSVAFERLESGGVEEIHDLRVALRRLRSWLRAYRPELSDTVRKKTRRRLAAIADATNAARDAEVAFALVTAIDGLSSRDEPGARYAADRFRLERDANQASARAKLDDALPDALAGLSDQLTTYWLRQAVSSREKPRDMASVTRDVLQKHADRFSQALRRVKSAEDADAAHRARIAAKRLRYVLEVLADEDAAALVTTLSELQDTLGVVHDGSRVVDRLLKEVEECAAHDARRAALASLHRRARADDSPSFATIRPGLVALARRAHKGQRTAFDAFRRHWRKRQIADTVARVVAVAARLSP